MKATTETNLSAKIISWIIVIVIAIGGVLFYRLYPEQNISDAELKKQKKHIVQKQKHDRNKKQQKLRALPTDYSEKLVQQSEVIVVKELNNRLRKFKEMSNLMTKRKEDYLTQVENRPLPASAPSNANDTSPAKAFSEPNSNLGSNPSVQDIYKLLREYEEYILQNHLAINAARETLSKGLSFPDVYASLQLGSSKMLKFDELIKHQSGDKEWNRSKTSLASAGLEVKNTEDLNRYRGLLGQVSRQVGLASARLERLFGIPSTTARAGGEGDGGGGGGGGEGGDGGGGGQGGHEGGDGTGKPLNYYQGPRLNQRTITAQALPGRRFARDSERKGWLYINTWYMIGPWDNFGRDDFAIVHPPEISIDFDAEYTNGKKGIGVAETDSHPLEMIGPKVYLDGSLRWQFKQSESMHNTVPVTCDRATYYAYTELYFEEATSMLVAIGTDDSGRVWINDKDVWRDSGSSWYNIDEHITTFNFREGWNTVLIRLENGDGPTGFSFLIIPTDEAAAI